MALFHMTPDNYIVSKWSGGTTTQVAIAPEGAVYADRDFLWRISSASVDLDESDFTTLPDYHRWISTLKGGMTLSHEGGEKIVLAPYEVHQFDGGVDTHSWGRCTDFNLMLRKGKCRGEICGLHLSAGKGRTILGEEEDCGQTALLIFCGQGACTVTEGTECVLLHEGESVLAEGAVEITAADAAALMIARVWF